MVVYNVHMRLQHLLFIAERTSKEILYSGSSSYVIVKVNIRTLQWRLRDKSLLFVFCLNIASQSQASLHSLLLSEKTKCT